MARTERLRINLTRDGETIVVAFIGDLDVYVAGDARTYLDEALDRAVAHSVGRIVIDAGRLRFCDSTGLSVFVSASDEAERRGVQLKLHSLSEPLKALVRLTGLDAALDGDL